ncbi:MAG: hypothetical protein ABSA75_14785 [Candidatus Bathyarchaeia archaeon]
MSSPWQSGLRDKALEALPEIDNLAKELLTPEKYEETNKVSNILLKPWEKRKWAHAKLIVEVGYRPTRPLYYLMPLLQGLPRGTRDCIRYLGDYIDLLTKELAFEYLGGNSRRCSLGRNATQLSKSNLSPEIKEIAKILIRYNEFLYNPGKHDFSLPPGRNHRFTAREVVLTTYITAIIAKRIKAVSKAACIAVEKDNLYIIGGRWGSNKRVKFAIN